MPFQFARVPTDQTTDTQAEADFYLENFLARSEQLQLTDFSSLFQLLSGIYPY